MLPGVARRWIHQASHKATPDKKDRANFVMFFTLPSSPKGYAGQDGKAGGLQILRCQGFAVVHYNFTLSAFRNEVEIPSPGDSEALRLLQRWGRLKESEEHDCRASAEISDSCTKHCFKMR